LRQGYDSRKSSDSNTKVCRNQSAIGYQQKTKIATQKASKVVSKSMEAARIPVKRVGVNLNYQSTGSNVEKE